MPIYMRIKKNGVPVIPGNATAKGHEKWIELTSFQFPLNRTSLSETTAGSPKRSEINQVVITKVTDSVSTQLAHLAAIGGELPTVEVDFVKTDPFEITYMRITLQNVFIDSWTVGKGAGPTPSEQFKLSFAGIEFDSNPSSNMPVPKSTGRVR